jgi:hypothetical protein
VDRQPDRRSCACTQEARPLQKAPAGKFKLRHYPILDYLEDVSDTDALAEWKAEAKRNIRDSVLHECLDIAESLGRRFAEATYASDEGRLQNAAKCYAAGEIATAIEARIATAVRQETNDD